MKSFCLLVFACLGVFFSHPVYSQGQSANSSLPASKTAPGAAAVSLTGIWRGYFVTETGQQYKLEFQVDHQTRAVRGVSYSYLDTRFYGKSVMTGSWDASNKKFVIEELRTVELRNTGDGGTCLMNYRLEFSQSGSELFLEGTYLGKTEDRRNSKNNGKWGDCGGGRVFLRRVETTEFPEEEFLKKKTPRVDTVVKTSTPPEKKTIPVVKRPVTLAKKTATAVVKPPVKKTTPTVAKTTVPAKNTTATPPPVTRNNRVDQAPSATSETVKKADPKPVVVPVQTRNRENATARLLEVRNEEILVKLYDNGEVDNDTISIYLDNKLVLSNKRLSTSPIELKLKLDGSSPEHVLVMVAENMGRIPPNTSLMIVWDGDKRYDVQITSTEQKNAMVRFRYVGAGKPETP
jgi:hypothetical protein